MTGHVAVATEVLYSDALIDCLRPEGDEFDPALDETEYDTRLRKAREQAAAERTAHLESGLQNVASRRRVYRDVACRSRALRHGPFRVLCFLLEYADNDLDNVFATRAKMAERLGMKLPTYDTYLARLRKSGWIRTHEFHRADGTQSSSGIQFCIPAGVLAPDDKGWVGPDTFTRRKKVQRRARRTRAVHDSATNGESK